MNHIYGAPTILFTGGATKSYHTFQPVHDSEIQELNLGGFKYWAYYTLPNALPPYEIHLARSNSLTSGWVDYGKVHDGRWPTVTFDGTTWHMFHKIYNISDWTTIYSTSSDGLTWTVQSTVGNGECNFLWKNPNDNQWYVIDFYTGGNGYLVQLRTSATIAGLVGAGITNILDLNVDTRAPSICYRNGKYQIHVEEDMGAYWRIGVYQASTILGPYTRSAILSANDEACPIVLKSGGTLYYFSNPYTNRISNYWDIAARTVAY